MKSKKKIKRDNRQLEELGKIKSMFPDYPDPHEWKDEGKGYGISHPSCKICSSPVRGLIETLIKSPTYSDTDVVKWANHHKVFEDVKLKNPRGFKQSKTLNTVNVSSHTKKHMKFKADMAVKKDIGPMLEYVRTLSPVHQAKKVADDWLADLLTHNRRISNSEGLKALEIQIKAGAELQRAEFMSELTDRLKRKRQKEDAKEVPPESVEVVRTG